jgi:hypothetical protein
VKVLVDTSVWSLSLRRAAAPARHPAAEEFARLIADYRVLLIGPVRQEILSGMRSEQQERFDATFHSRQHERPARIDFYRARVVDGLGQVIHERLFAA